jgi:hypothetical protein
MDSSSAEVTRSQKLPWKVPTVTRVPIVIKTRGGHGIAKFDASKLDDAGS